MIELRSDLGGGKTTFAKGLVRGAGSNDRVVSPTFTLSRIYQAKKFDVHHFDFYRLNDPGILAGQLAESIQDDNVVVVEWAGIVQNVLPAERISIEFAPTTANPDERQITIEYPLSKEPLISKVETKWQASQP